MQLKLLQAEQEETRRAIEEEKEQKKNSVKVGRRTEANTAQGRAEGDPKAGELIMWLCESRRPSVTLCADRRTHASRRGLWEGGVALRGCALLLSFPFFPPSRPSSPPVLWPSPPLTFRLQGRYLCGSLMWKQRACCPWG
ncbi:hypothetical protein VZT92_025946 [Zoarces viviparus]|uniref:Uncharacterized protein n=1 Tax=Zoarces viviparus TaxID=48416 RepID=A0AAW1DY13_ZOAVI